MAPKLNYTEQQMLDALADVKSGMSVRASAKLHGVPRVTLLNKHKGKFPIRRKMGPCAYLSKDEEDILVSWIVEVSRAGFPVTRGHLLNTAKKLFGDLKRENVFTDGMPGRSWYKSFLNRNPSVGEILSRNLTISRAKVTMDSLKSWFEQIHQYLSERGHDGILEFPNRVFNCYEHAFFLNPKGTRMVAMIGKEDVYQAVNSDDKECLTVLVTGNAAGQYGALRIVPNSTGWGVPHDWGLGKSNSGRKTAQLFHDYLKEVFHPWLLRKNIELPIILFVNGHVSHLTYDTSRFCEDNGIILISLHPNATHIMQPMDISVFRALEVHWKHFTHQCRDENVVDPEVIKEHFASLLKNAVSMLSPDSLINGFRRCGLCPWNFFELYYVLEDCDDISQAASVAPSKQKVDECKIVLKVMKEHLSAEQLAAFEQQGDIYSGHEQDKSLYKFWQIMSTIAKSSIGPSPPLPSTS